MSVAQDLGAVLDFAEQPLSRLDVFTDHIPQEWISTAATLAEKATVRRRRLPSDMVLWLVVGMALFRGEPIVEVARRLNICADGLANEVLLAKSGLSQARQRLGNQPVSWLFRQCASTWGYERYPQDDWHGLQVFAVDGALFRTPETPQLRAHFGSGNTSSNRQTPYPVLRLVALMNARSHIIANAAISPYRKGEIPLAKDFVESIPNHSVTLLDKGFFSADLLLSIQNAEQNRHWMIPERKGTVRTEVEHYGDGDYLVQMRVSPQARKKNPALPEYWQVRAVTEGNEKTVFTSLPASKFSAEQVATLYHERWEIELGFRDIKSSMQDNALTLRSKTVDLVYQELWGLLLAYNVVRREASQAAVAHKRAPSEISFKFACQHIASHLVVMAGAVSPSHTPRRLEELRGSIGVLFITKRPRPARPRAVKMSKTRYPVNRKAAPLK
ncbi:IS4-like element ISPsy33 family transposase [Pseudomonas syringae pv. actinidiae]|nr:IS4-like element ISPsy33 family transposase [Pseudomonas syringae]WCE92527.1 IS4-like element ISPsy33 family transposase [Pseudomonas syringae pv. actinidiae]WOK34920.1 IS4-like element ISPsy33 family transposase [Pseudomonas syringae pv. actinidiae]